MPNGRISMLPQQHNSRIGGVYTTLHYTTLKFYTTLHDSRKQSSSHLYQFRYRRAGDESAAVAGGALGGDNHPQRDALAEEHSVGVVGICKAL